jgi:hypothetical protein
MALSIPGIIAPAPIFVFPRLSPMLEILHGALMLLSLLTRVKSAKIAPLSRFRVFLRGIEPIFSGLEFSNHNYLPKLWLNLRSPKAGQSAKYCQPN